MILTKGHVDHLAFFGVTNTLADCVADRLSSRPTDIAVFVRDTVTAPEHGSP